MGPTTKRDTKKTTTKSIWHRLGRSTNQSEINKHHIFKSKHRQNKRLLTAHETPRPSRAVSRENYSPGDTPTGRPRGSTAGVTSRIPSPQRSRTRTRTTRKTFKSTASHSEVRFSKNQQYSNIKKHQELDFGHYKTISNTEDLRHRLRTIRSDSTTSRNNAPQHHQLANKPGTSREDHYQPGNPEEIVTDLRVKIHHRKRGSRQQQRDNRREFKPERRPRNPARVTPKTGNPGSLVKPVDLSQTSYLPRLRTPKRRFKSHFEDEHRLAQHIRTKQELLHAAATRHQPIATPYWTSPPPPLAQHYVAPPYAHHCPATQVLGCTGPARAPVLSAPALTQPLIEAYYGAPPMF